MYKHNREIAHAYGPVITDQTHNDYIGAQNLSNNTGELTAINEALKWIIETKPEPGSHVNISYDSTYAAYNLLHLYKRK